MVEVEDQRRCVRLEVGDIIVKFRRFTLEKFLIAVVTRPLKQMSSLKTVSFSEQQYQAVLQQEFTNLLN